MKEKNCSAEAKTIFDLSQTLNFKALVANFNTRERILRTSLLQTVTC